MGNLHQMYLDVMTNKEKLYGVRAMIEENRARILENYSAAFIGNRQVALQNTDDLFKNRHTILNTMKYENQRHINFLNTKHNESNILYLEHRSLLNNRVAK